MFVSKLPYIIYRDYPDCGYLTDNRNFGYDTASYSCKKTGDILLSKEGSVFYSILEDYPKSMNSIVNRLAKIYEDVSLCVLYNDAVSFYQELYERGFVLLGDKEDCEHKPAYFSYEDIYKKDITSIKDNFSITSDFFTQQQYRLTRVHIDISSYCNENCIHCYIPSQNKCGIMGEEVFDRVLEQCVKMRVLNITISGGEPLLNPHLKSFLLKCKKANFSINLLSNLTLLSDDLLTVFIQNPLISIQTSLYAMEANVHDSITRNIGSFDKTISAINKLHAYNVPLQINCPIMKQNLHAYQAVLDYAKSLNIATSSDYALFGCYDGSGVNLACRISYTDVVKVLQSEYMHKQILGDDLQKNERKKIHVDNPICPICKSSLCVSNTGDVYPCEGWQRMKLGNILLNDMQYLWEENPMTLHLRNLTYKHFLKCRSCNNKQYCTTCLIMNANENSQNDYMLVNPYMCELAEIKRRELMKREK